MGLVIRKSAPRLRVLAFALTAAAIASIATAKTAPVPLPNGKYTYAIAERGKEVSTSTIVVSRAGGALLIDEHASPMEATENARRTLDPATFATRSYENDSGNRRILTVTISGNTATLQQGSVTTRIAAPPHAPFVISDMFVALFFHLPATLHATKTMHLTLANLGFGGFKADPLAASPSRAGRPMNVPVRDSAVDVTFEGQTAILWYDPQTLVLDECDMPAIRFVFMRTSQS